MAHLEKLFSEGPPDRPYHTLDSHVTYKSETATAEMKEIKPVKKEFHPITTEIHVTELRPIKLDPMPKRGTSESQYANSLPGNKKQQMWERRLQSESSLTDKKAHTLDRSYTANYQNSYTENTSEQKSNMIKTVTSRTGSNSSSSSATSPNRVVSPNEFKRRDVSPDFKFQERKVMMVDGKCQCCPYGYHVDVDFMEYCDSMSNQSYLKQLKRVQREKRKLRKSMEVYLQEQQQENITEYSINPMESQTYYQEATTNKLLDEIDTSVDQTLSSIETMMTSSSQRYTDSGTATMTKPERKFNTFPKKVGKEVAKELQTYNETFTATFKDRDRADSNSSLSSISTAASEKGFQGYSTTETTTTKMTSVTSEHLAETMATHLPVEDGAASHQSNMTTISKESLQAIRDAVAVSLQKMKDLEEQVKAIPVLQVRISVLKEEKRLLGLQMDAKKNLNYVSRGVGDDTIFVEPPLSPKTPPPVAPKPKVRVAAVGDHSVLEPYLLQPEVPSSYTVKDNSTHVYERQTLVIDRAQKQNALYTPGSQKPLTRSIGVGDGNVLDDTLHIHEKELRTVIIGQGTHTGKRNVGIECRVPTRDIGISYNFDMVEKPSTRTVGISTDTTALVTNVTFRSEEFTSALKNALSKSVRSVAIQVDSQKQFVNVGVQHSSSAWNIRTIAVGDCSVDVEVRNRVGRRSIGVDAFPDRMNHAVNTDYGWRLDAATNTYDQYTESCSTQTDQARTHASSTMTERVSKYHASCQTDVQVFRATDQLKNSWTNTEKTLTYSTGMNTILRPTTDRGINTSNQKITRSASVNTTGPDVRNIGVSEDRVDLFVCDLEDKNSEEEYRMEEEAIETKTVYYSTTSDKEDSKTDKGYEIKREYATDSYATQSSQQEITEETDEIVEQNEEIVEEKIWKTSGDGQFTVTTVTTRKVFGGDADGTYVTDTKTVTGGPEILGSDAEMIQREVARGRRSSEGGFSSSTRSSEGGFSSSTGSYEGGFESGRRSYEGSYESSSTSGSSRMSSSSTEGSTAVERVIGAENLRKLYEQVDASHSIDGNSSLAVRADMDELQRASSDSGMSSSQMSSSSEHSTSYTTIIREGSGSPQVSYQEYSYSSGDGTPHFFSSRSDSGIAAGSSGSSASSSASSFMKSSSSRYTDNESPLGTLKSIMKKSSSDPGTQKKGITFAESVVGGESDDNSSEGHDSQEEEEEEQNGSRGTTSDSDSSYDEGSYDSREGSIVYKCKDDEAIANGLPGAKMFDQNIRETFELGRDMKEACRVLSTYLEDSTTIQTKQLKNTVTKKKKLSAVLFLVSAGILSKIEKKNASLEVIQAEWLKVSASKLADAHQVEDYLSCFNEISKRSLEYIVNMQDSNGNTAMHYAVSNCNFEIVNLLLDTGVVDLNKLNKAGYTAIIMATLASVQTHRHEEVVQRLFSMGNVNIKAAKDGQTALMFAVRQGRTEMVKMLLDTGANTNIQDDEGSTALMCAAEHGHTEICKMLLNTAGCDANISDNDGSTALSIAMEAGHKDVGVLLYAHVNFGPGVSPEKGKKSRKSSGTSPLPSPVPK